MEIYLYCNYTNSKLGFHLTHLKGNKLEPISLCGSCNKGEQAVDRFFSFDRFHVLWQEIQQDEKNVFNPEPTMSLFGVRGIHGKISDRDGIINIAILSSEYEMHRHERLARGILSEMRRFCRDIFAYFAISGENGYELNAEEFVKFIGYFERVGGTAEVPFVIGNGMSTAKDLLRMGVYSGSREEAVSDFGPSWLWFIKPKQLIGAEEFRKISGVRLY